ncbi:YwdI family protein [Metabacillus fastidiosus]|uniref:YwdI family protein n=1 Tax=Metabacillus fastidiosus TaxID=1458 RepID=A0ABU6P388_9BACI|nr:YwdI family protein [Metabacillus fastidiosus]MED4403827.1 YwdI family protein [Metabacillus fastidiosus]MED4456081.1 YwdI family protein [Metabacillus fastidiosus]MED4464371.1 YwdI family protein [Metabacillus fastidiosus]
MNIHVSKLLLKMEQELQKAKTMSDEKEIREHISIIHSLCEVILGEKTEQVIQHSQPLKDFNQIELQKMMGSKTVSRVQEEDGNGDSIFDF